jgi:hypothetical protein
MKGGRRGPSSGRALFNLVARDREAGPTNQIEAFIGVPDQHLIMQVIMEHSYGAFPLRGA